MARVTSNQDETIERRLVPVLEASDVVDEHRGTPVEDLLLAQNLGRPFPVGPAPTLFIATCIDSRIRLSLPPGAAFELRSAGVNLGRPALFQVAFAVSVARLRHVALVSHDDCAMKRLPHVRRAFVEGLVENTDWDEASAEAFFNENAARWHRIDPIGAVVLHAHELRGRFPSVSFATLHYTVGDGQLAQIVEDAG